MLRDITNTAVKIKMLSATPMLSAIAQPHPLCYLPHLWWDRISISNYNNSCMKQTKFHIVTCLENFGDFGLLRRPKINVLAVLPSSLFSGTMRIARKKKLINFLICEASTVKKLTIWKIAIEWGDVATPLNEIHWILTFPQFSHIFLFWIPSTFNGKPQSPTQAPEREFLCKFQIGTSASRSGPRKLQKSRTADQDRKKPQKTGPNWS